MKTEKSAPKGAKTSKKSNKNKDIMIKDKLLLQALKVHIPVLGWGEDAVSEAALELNYDVNQALALFGALPEGLLLHCADWADRYMAEAARAYDIESLRVRDRVALLLRL